MISQTQALFDASAQADTREIAPVGVAADETAARQAAPGHSTAVEVTPMPEPAGDGPPTAPFAGEMDAGVLVVVCVLLLAFSAGVMYFAGVFRRRALTSESRSAGHAPAGLLGIGLLAFGLFVVTPSLIVLAAGLTQEGAGAQGPTGSAREQFINVAVVIGYAVGGLGLAAMILAQRPGQFSAMGLSHRMLPRSILPSVIAILAVFPLMFVVLQATLALWELLNAVHEPQHDMLRMLMQSQSWQTRLLIVFSAAVCAPVFEEIVFRGCLQTALREMTGRPWLAIFTTSAVFAGIHTWWSAPAIFVLSVCLGYLYERTGNLWTAILLHAAFNGTSVAVTLLAPS